jgi:LPXTG-site transpeptidase (sortase) family protein
MFLSRKLINRSLLASACLIGLLVMALVGLPVRTAFAQTDLTIEQITWSIIGLDTNDVNAGPNEFPIGVRVCNDGDDMVENLTVTFAWTNANERIALINEAGTVQTIDPVEEGECVDVYYWASVQRNTASYGATRNLTITAEGDDVSVNTSQQLRVERLEPVATLSTSNFSGPDSLNVGETYSWDVSVTTPATGSPELVHFLTMCPNILRVVLVEADYTQPPDEFGENFWADGCAWDTANNSGCTATGTNIRNFGGTVEYFVEAEVIAPGSCTLRSVVYDFSSNAYHYNNNYSSQTFPITASGQAAPTATTAATTAAQATATQIPTNTPGGPTNTPGPSPTPTRTPTPTDTPRVTDTPEPEQLPATGSRLHPSQLLPTMAANLAPTQVQITIAIIITLVMGVALAIWVVMMSTGILPKESAASKRVLQSLSVMFIVCALVLAGMLGMNLVRASLVAHPPEPQTGAPADGGQVALYMPPEIPATRLIIPELKIDTDLTEAPRLGSSWDVSIFFNEIAHLEGTAFPGTTGNAVLAGHVNHTKGVGPFWNLRALQKGNMIIARGEGVEYRYKVDWVEVVDPSEVEMLENTDEPVLTLISCSDWDSASWSYTKRLVVRAKFFDRARFEASPTPFDTATPGTIEQ